MHAPENEQAALRRLIGGLQRAYRAGATRLALARFGWTALALVGTLTLLDAVWPLPAGVRAALALASAPAVAAFAVATCLRARRARSLDRHIARRVEAGSPAIGNDLINALDFSERLSSSAIPAPAASSADSFAADPIAADPITAELMHRTISRAVAEMQPSRNLSPLMLPVNLRRESRIFALAALLTLAAALLFGSVWLAEAPRYFDPWGDHPPYSPTRLRVTPEGSRIDYGDRLLVNVASSGVLAREAYLNIETAAGDALNRLPMFEREEGSFFQAIEQVKQPLRYFVSVPGGRSRRYEISLNETPRVESVTLALRPPAYTHLPEQLRLLQSDAIKSQAGSVARLTFASNRPLHGGQLRFGEQTLALTKTGENQVAGELTLAKPGEASVELEDIDGNKSGAIWRAKIEILPDEKPTVSIVSPGMDSFAIPTIKLPLIVEASDDLGFNAVTLVRNINGSMDLRKPLYAGDGTERNVHSVETLDLADLGVRPGDVISYYAMATDSLPDTPQTAVTPIYQLAIISLDEFREYMQETTTAEDLNKKYRDYQEQLEKLAKEQEELAKLTEAFKKNAAAGEPLNQSERKQLAEAQRLQQELARQTSSLAAQMKEDAANPPVFDIEKSFKAEMKKTAKQLEGAKTAMQKADAPMQQAGQPSADAPTAEQSLDKAAQSQRAAQQTLQQAAGQYGESVGAASGTLAGGSKLLDDADQFKYLYERQKSLERQSRLFQDANSPSAEEKTRMSELSDEQRAVRAELEKVAADLKLTAKEVEKDLPKAAADARKIADEIGRREIPGTMGQAGDRMAEADGPRAQPLAADALARMDAMMGYCDGAASAARDELRISLSKGRGMSMGQTLQQMAASGAGLRGSRSAGADGSTGGASRFAVFGPDRRGQPNRDSRIAGPPHNDPNLAGAPAQPSISSIEEFSTDTAASDRAGVGPGERPLEEYRPLIDAYFKGLAEDNR